MGKILFSLCFILSVSTFAQTVHSSLLEGYRFNKFLSEVTDGQKKIKYEDVNGIPYLTKSFARGKISGIDHELLIRYSPFLDSFEVRINDDVYEIPKSFTFSTIRFLENGKQFILVSTGDANDGYFEIIASGSSKLLKKHKTEFRPERPSLNPIIPGTPPTFEVSKPVYYIQYNNIAYLVPKSIKDLPDVIAEKAEALKLFIKENRIKTVKEYDLIRIVQFLNKY